MTSRANVTNAETRILHTGLGQEATTITIGDQSLVVVHGNPLDPSYDRVMPVFEDESVYVARRVAEVARGLTLDIGTGSGILALAAATQGCTAVGTDVNEMATRYAEQSARRSTAGSRCQFLTGDMYEPVAGRVFDTVVFNPPFVPLPHGFRFFLSADGGPDGLGIIRRALDGLDRHFAWDGTLLLLTMALGDHQEPRVYRLLREAFRRRGGKITSTHIYETRSIEAEGFFSLFASAASYTEWRHFLDKERLTHLYYVLHQVEPHGRVEHSESQNALPLVETSFSGSWRARLNRFKTWFERKTLARDAGCRHPSCAGRGTPVRESAVGDRPEGGNVAACRPARDEQRPHERRNGA